MGKSRRPRFRPPYKKLVGAVLISLGIGMLAALIIQGWGFVVAGVLLVVGCYVLLF